MAISIVDITPTPGASGVDITQPIEVILSTAIDPTSVGFGSFFIESTSKELLTGVWAPVNYGGTSADSILSNPFYGAITRGEYELYYMSTDLSTTYGTSFTDTSGTSSYYSKLIFRPHAPLSPGVSYKIYLTGTSTSQLNFGIHSRTVFDIIETKSGNGSLFSYGGYTSMSTSTFFVEMSGSGVVGQAQYKWKKDSSAWSLPTVTHSFKRYLSDGVSISFSLDGTHALGDSFQFIAKPREFLPNYYFSTFVTGEQGTAIARQDTSLLPSSVANLPFAAIAGLSLHYTLPYNYSCLSGTSTTSFQFVFDKNIAATSIDTNGIMVYIGPSNGDTSIRSETSYYANNYSVSANRLTIYLENT